MKLCNSLHLKKKKNPQTPQKTLKTQNAIAPKQLIKKKIFNIPRCLFRKFLFEKACFIRPTAATIRHESDPVLAAEYQTLFFMNRDVPNMSYMMTDRNIWQHIHAACASSKMSDAEKLVLSQASVFCPQTTASDPTSAAAYFLISTCSLSLSSQSRKISQTQHRACSESQLSKSDWK